LFFFEFLAFSRAAPRQARSAGGHPSHNALTSPVDPALTGSVCVSFPPHWSKRFLPRIYRPAWRPCGALQHRRPCLFLSSASSCRCDPFDVWSPALSFCPATASFLVSLMAFCSLSNFFAFVCFLYFYPPPLGRLSMRVSRVQTYCLFSAFLLIYSPPDLLARDL